MAEDLLDYVPVAYQRGCLCKIAALLGLLVFILFLISVFYRFRLFDRLRLSFAFALALALGLCLLGRNSVELLRCGAAIAFVVRNHRC